MPASASSRRSPYRTAVTGGCWLAGVAATGAAGALVTAAGALAAVGGGAARADGAAAGAQAIPSATISAICAGAAEYRRVAISLWLSSLGPNVPDEDRPDRFW